MPRTLFVDAGRLRHRVEIQRNVSTTQNEFGEPIDDWEALAQNVPASVEPLTGREFLLAQQTSSIVTHKVTIRHRRDKVAPTTKMRIRHRNRFLGIEAVMNIEERDKMIILMCSEDT